MSLKKIKAGTRDIIELNSTCMYLISNNLKIWIWQARVVITHNQKNCLRHARRFTPLTLSLWAYAIIMRCLAKGKQLNKKCSCCWCCLHFNSFRFVCNFFFVCLIISSINRFVFITFVLSSQTWLRSSFLKSFRLLYNCYTLVWLNLLCACCIISYFIACWSFCQSR